MEYNKSLSARIKRRNKQGFKGAGNNNFWEKKTPFGNYLDEYENNKYLDYKIAQSRKDSLKAKTRGRRSLSKKYANNMQKFN